VCAVGILAGYYALRNGSYDLVVRQLEGLNVWAAVAAVAIAGLGPRVRLPRPALVAGGCAAGYVLWVVLSFTWTDSAERTFAELARVLHYLGIVALIWFVVGRRTWTAVAAGLAVAALGISTLAVLARLMPQTFPEAQVALFAPGRLSYPLEYWNAIAAWGSMAVALGLGFSAHAESRIGRGLALAAVPVALLSVYLAESRGGVIAVIAAVVFVVALSRNRWVAVAHSAAAVAGAGIAVQAVKSNPAIENATGSAGAGEVGLALGLAAGACATVAILSSTMRLDRLRLPRDTARGVLIGGIAVALVAVAIGGHGPIGDAWDEFANDKTVDRSEREQLQFNLGGTRKTAFDSAVAAFKSEPLTGIGPGAFEFWWTREGRNQEHLRDAHSLYLEQLAEVGVPGLLLLLGVLGGILWLGILARARAVTDRRAGAAAATTAAFGVFCVHAGIDWMWEMTAVAVLGLACGATAAVGAGRSTTPLRAGRPRVAIAIAAILIALLQLPGVLSTQRTREAQEALDAGDPYRAMSLAADASDYEPWAASPHVARSVAAIEAGRLDIAKREILDAIEKEPANWQGPLVLAKIEAVRGNEVAARAALGKARRLGPELAAVETEGIRIQHLLEPGGTGG